MAKTNKKRVSYRAKVGCWNCDLVYDIAVKLGTVAPMHLQDKNLTCRNCGCDSLRPFEDFKINKKIMKDLVLQTRLEEGMHEDGAKRPKHDHIQ